MSCVQVVRVAKNDIGNALPPQDAMKSQNDSTACDSSEAARLHQLQQQRIRKIR